MAGFEEAGQLRNRLEVANSGRCIYSIHVCICIYISIIIILVFRVCVCVCVCLFVTSEFSGTGRRSATPLSPTWRASPGELQRLHLKLTRCVLRERKPLELFRWQHVKPRPSCYNGAILKKWVVFLKRFAAFSPSTGTQQGRRMSSLHGKLR